VVSASVFAYIWQRWADFRGCNGSSLSLNFGHRDETSQAQQRRAAVFTAAGNVLALSTSFIGKRYMLLLQRGEYCHSMNLCSIWRCGKKIWQGQFHSGHPWMSLSRPIGIHGNKRHWKEPIIPGLLADLRAVQNRELLIVSNPPVDASNSVHSRIYAALALRQQ
jgi:hypothetical protein